MTVESRPSNNLTQTDQQGTGPDLHRPEIRKLLKRYWLTNVAITIVLLVVWAIAGLGCGVLAQGINPQGIGTVGMLIKFAVTLSLTPLCPGPSEKTQRMIDSVREP